MFGRNASYQDRARTYIDRQLNRELPRMAKRARKSWDDLDLDRDVLGRAGLMRTSQAPGLGAAVGLFVLGGITGGILALLWAPKTGVQTRQEVKQRAQGLMNQGRQRMEEQAQDLSASRSHIQA